MDFPVDATNVRNGYRYSKLILPIKHLQLLCMAMVSYYYQIEYCN